MRRLIRLAGAAGMTAVALLSAGSAARAADALPYKDSAKVGTITLCDKAGQPLTKGSVDDAPFAWTAHTDVAPPQGYAITGKTASLFIYQPRVGVPPGDWSGQAMTPASRYDDVQHPTVQFTAGDDALNQMTTSYPPLWNGLYELRMYLSAPEQPFYKTQYAALDIKVSDDLKTWAAVDPGSLSCSVGTATSITTILHITPAPSTTPPAPSSVKGSGSSHAATPTPTAPAVSVAPGQSPVPTTGYAGGLAGFPQSIHPGSVPVDPTDASDPTDRPAAATGSSHVPSGGRSVWQVIGIAAAVIAGASLLSALVGSRRKRT